jgi:hypothetical protein
MKCESGSVPGSFSSFSFAPYTLESYRKGSVYFPPMVGSDGQREVPFGTFTDLDIVRIGKEFAQKKPLLLLQKALKQAQSVQHFHR